MARPIDPHRDEFIAKILSQATVLFAQQGYRNSTMEDISKRVKLKKSSLYHYFASKEHILFEAVWVNLNRSLEPLVALQNAGGPPRDRLRKAVAVLVQSMIDAPYVGSLFLNERSSLAPRRLKQCLELRKRHELAICSMVDQGVADCSFADIETNIAVKLIFGALNWIPWWWRANGKYTPEQTAEVFADLLVDRFLGTSPEQGRTTDLVTGAAALQSAAPRSLTMPRSK
jgi:TetR/AcrR family transcriptional regulator